MFRCAASSHAKASRPASLAAARIADRSRGYRRAAIPLTEMMIRPLARGMVEIVSTRIHGQLVDQLRIKPGLLANLRIRCVQNRQRAFDQILVHALSYANVFYVERNGAHALVRIGLHLPLRFEHGNWPVSEI